MLKSLLTVAATVLVVGIQDYRFSNDDCELDEARMTIRAYDSRIDRIQFTTGVCIRLEDSTEVEIENTTTGYYLCSQEDQKFYQFIADNLYQHTTTEIPLRLVMFEDRDQDRQIDRGEANSHIIVTYQRCQEK